MWGNIEQKSKMYHRLQFMIRKNSLQIYIRDICDVKIVSHLVIRKIIKAFEIKVFPGKNRTRLDSCYYPLFLLQLLFVFNLLRQVQIIPTSQCILINLRQASTASISCLVACKNSCSPTQIALENLLEFSILLSCFSMACRSCKSSINSRI